MEFRSGDFEHRFSRRGGGTIHQNLDRSLSGEQRVSRAHEAGFLAHVEFRAHCRFDRASTRTGGIDIAASGAKPLTMQCSRNVLAELLRCTGKQDDIAAHSK